MIKTWAHGWNRAVSRTCKQDSIIFSAPIPSPGTATMWTVLPARIPGPIPAPGPPSVQCEQASTPVTGQEDRGILRDMTGGTPTPDQVMLCHGRCASGGHAGGFSCYKDNSDWQEGSSLSTWCSVYRRGTSYTGSKNGSLQVGSTTWRKAIAYINSNQTVADILKAKREYEKQNGGRKIFSSFGT